MIHIIGHRGVPSHAFENSLSGFRLGHALGLSWVELDVWQTQSGDYVVFHDRSLNRCTNSQGSILEWSYQSRDDILLKNGDFLPLLSEVVDIFRGSSVGLIVEIKQSDRAILVYEFIKKYAPDANIVIASFFHSQILDLKIMYPESKTCLIIEGDLINMSEYFHLSRADYLSLGFESFDGRSYDAVKELSKKLLFWTVNTEEDVKSALEYQPFGIITNYPLMAAQVVSLSQIS